MSLSNAALTALEGKNSIQEEIRDICNEHDDYSAGDIIAAEVGLFRAGVESWIQGGDVSVRRKQVNNIINDISRICRECIGKSIVCTSRKGGHVYEAKTPKVKAKSTPTSPANPSQAGSWPPPPSARDVFDLLGKLNESSKKVAINTITRKNRIQVMETLIGMGKEEFTRVYLEAKENIDNEVQA